MVDVDRAALMATARTLRAQAAILERLAGADAPYRRGTYTRARVVRMDLLLAVLDERRLARELTWRGLALETGLSPSTFSRMRQGAAIDLDAFATLLGWLDVPAETFLDDAA